MKSRITSFLATLVAVLAWSSSAYAGCTNEEFAGTWDFVFSDGNACSLVFNEEGEVLIAGDSSLSICLDPFRGVTEPDSGMIAVGSDCSVDFDLLVEDIEIDLFGRIAQSHDIGAGFFVMGAFGVKGSFTMIEVDDGDSDSDSDSD